MRAGDRLTWLHTPRGGYGYIIPVAAEVVRITPKGRVVIRVKNRAGYPILRTVKPENLR